MLSLKPMHRDNDVVAFFQMQGYGDLVILANMLKKYTISNKKINIIMGSYLFELFTELDLDVKSIFLKLEGNDIPPLFNLKNKGFVKGFYSALQIRSLLLKNYRKDNFSIIFDSTLNLCGIRERLISSKIPRVMMKSKNNIYLTYINYIKSIDNFKIYNKDNLKLKKGNLLAIFPTSRQKRKCIPENILEYIIKTSIENGFKPQIFNIKGEDEFQLHLSKYHIVLPKNFSNIINVIKKSKALVSADSLPAHIGEYYDVPTFVLSPIDNGYWLPLSTLKQGFWSKFNDYKKMMKIYQIFLDKLNNKLSF